MTNGRHHSTAVALTQRRLLKGLATLVEQHYSSAEAGQPLVLMCGGEAPKRTTPPAATALTASAYVSDDDDAAGAADDGAVPYDYSSDDGDDTDAADYDDDTSPATLFTSFSTSRATPAGAGLRVAQVCKGTASASNQPALRPLLQQQTSSSQSSGRFHSVNHLQGPHRRHPEDTQVVQVTLLVTRPGGSPEEVELDLVSDDLRVKGDTLGTAAAVNSLSAWLPVGATGAAAAAASASNSSSSSASSTTATAAAVTGLHSRVLLSCSAAGLQPLHACEDAAQGLLRQGIAPLAQQLSGAAQLPIPQKRLKAAQHKWGLQHAESWTVKQAAAVAAAGGSAEGRDAEASLQQFLAAALCTSYTASATAHELVAGAALRQQGVRLVGGALRSAMLGEEPNHLDLHLSSDCSAVASSGGDHVAAAEAVVTAICADLAGEQLASDGCKSGGSGSSNGSNNGGSCCSSRSSITSTAATQSCCCSCHRSTRCSGDYYYRAS
jgi:hypothetical protein